MFSVKYSRVELCSYRIASWVGILPIKYNKKRSRLTFLCRQLVSICTISIFIITSILEFLLLWIDRKNFPYIKGNIHAFIHAFQMIINAFLLTALLLSSILYSKTWKLFLNILKTITRKTGFSGNQYIFRYIYITTIHLLAFLYSCGLSYNIFHLLKI